MACMQTEHVHSDRLVYIYRSCNIMILRDLIVLDSVLFRTFTLNLRHLG